MNRLGNIICDSSELRKLIAENLDLPIVFLVDSEVVADADYCGSWYCSDIKCYVGEILDCDFSDEKVYSDRGDFEDDLEDSIWNNIEEYLPRCKSCKSGGCDTCVSDGEFDEIFSEELKKYEPYWTECIIVHGTN